VQEIHYLKVSMTTEKSVPKNWKKIIEAETIDRCITRLAYEIIERDRNLGRLALVGIRTYGEVIARRIQAKIKHIEKIEVPFGVLDITLYRDDLSRTKSQPTLKGTDLPFNVTGSRIILVDDILFTGRTIRAALDAIIDFGRPELVELAVLIDRGHRELPIRADYVGKNVPSHKEDMLRLRLKEMADKEFVKDGGEDAVYLVAGGYGAAK